MSEESHEEHILDRWFRRFQRSLSYFSRDVFEDEQFETLVAALVTGATIEGLLLLGIQFCGYEAEPGRQKKRWHLEP